MVRSKASLLDLDHDDHHQLMDGPDGDVGAVPPSSSDVSCSICLDLVSDTGGRSRAKLLCGHQFHLDCIGSAFNMKGAMQCPNCRKVEKGQWLYANGSNRSLPELTMEDWNLDDDYYEPVYSEMQFRAQWCPYGEFTRIGSSSEEVESPSTTYHEIHGHHAIFAEHAAASSVAHSYVAYVGPLPSTTLRNSDSVDDPNVNRHWNILSGHNEILIPHALPTISIQYHSWGRHSPNFSISNSHIGSTDPASVPAAALRSSNGEPDASTVPRLFGHPFPFEHGSSSRGGSSFVSSVFHHHPGSGAHTHDRTWPSLAYYRQQHRFNQQRFNRPGVPAPVVPGIRGVAPMTPAVPQPDQTGGFYVYPRSSSSGQNLPEAESSYPNNYIALERERLSHFRTVSRVTGWGAYRPTSGSGSGNRSGTDHR
ncbi:hypothetical protein ERO13_A08G117700v2 [Gossypium hirsutum]|uniref:RING-type domain-containing protein n=4 Tax=Gossypium TaxID=3633 RepID=A0ABR0P157_GOSAR|nr:E3 ubiquitin-protein ligase RFI2 isoform X2 [Gossypium hirsutum]XP_017626254.1 E3 ubiquitin-protein ligase RFI2 isoform X2 [Gossypium arboreum]KAB2069983.1 hypothetical protein ES319_A08G128100v1 [Gossypium barbadense]TYI14718.1 hypothetical protein ES332_A08G139600v1 [Gossypium tomentosum]KAG4187702.1 hypothetical protein ERO13_A08G117700v2 [Gossypium hirsutum]KAK5812303.1 hypothetical protein PVK06_027731 [Gossypium arboreum]